MHEIQLKLQLDNYICSPQFTLVHSIPNHCFKLQYLISVWKYSLGALMVDILKVFLCSRPQCPISIFLNQLDQPCVYHVVGNVRIYNHGLGNFIV